MDMLDLFSGAGGLTLGLERAGFRTLFAVDYNPDSAATYRSAFPGVRHECCPVENIDFRHFAGIDFIAGGPPCQPFSIGGKRLANEDSRNAIPEFLRAVAEARPRAFLMENVPGLAAGDRRPYFTLIRERMVDLGYSVTWEVVNAADYGIPQKRRRLIVVGMLGRPFDFPGATHGPIARRQYAAVREFLDPSRVLGEPNPSRVFYARNPDPRRSPYGGHLFNGGGRAVELDGPCHTILASAGGNKTHFFDPLGEVPRYHAHLLAGGPPRSGVLDGARRLTVAESAVLQTFPPGMQFAGSRSSQYSQVGNAVPPQLAYVIGSALARQLPSYEAMRVQRLHEPVHQFDAGLLPV